ncbi:hypothetical protein F5884DRAFT_888820 [Xylogone sp. PMI_703]|nr:hypothetical protein F5884DRAFT_888820 [Xylogone sp. PMI_703]
MLIMIPSKLYFVGFFALLALSAEVSAIALAISSEVDHWDPITQKTTFAVDCDTAQSNTLTTEVQAASSIINDAIATIASIGTDGLETSTDARARVYRRLWNKGAGPMLQTTFNDMKISQTDTNVVVLHCGNTWKNEAIERGHKKATSATCDGHTNAYTSILQTTYQGDKRYAAASYQPGGTFQNGVHIVFCDEWFNKIASTNSIGDASVGRYVDFQVTVKAKTVVHELAHAVNKDITDIVVANGKGAYGWTRAQTLVNGNFGSPRLNADSYAIWAMLTTNTNKASSFDWTSGKAA